MFHVQYGAERDLFGVVFIIIKLSPTCIFTVLDGPSEGHPTEDPYGVDCRNGPVRSN